MCLSSRRSARFERGRAARALGFRRRAQDRRRRLRRCLEELARTHDCDLLDEMDQLVSKAQGILYELLADARQVAVRRRRGGQRHQPRRGDASPRLAARGCEPAVVRFNAYDRDQLKLLLRRRLGSLPAGDVFEDAGLELCSRKVAPAATGDMRRALNIRAAAVDLCARFLERSGGEDGGQRDGRRGKRGGNQPVSSPREDSGERVAGENFAHGARHLGVVFIPGGGHHARACRSISRW